jgi:hypothetical protein
MKKQDPNQLWLDFREAVKSVRTAAEQMEKAAEALHRSPEVPAAKKTEAVEEVVELRRRLNRIVRHLAKDRNLHWREIWEIVFRRLRESTGFDARSKALAKGIRPLDAIQQGGKLQAALRVAAAV